MQKDAFCLGGGVVGEGVSSSKVICSGLSFVFAKTTITRAHLYTQ